MCIHRRGLAWHSLAQTALSICKGARLIYTMADKGRGEAGETEVLKTGDIFIKFPLSDRVVVEGKHLNRHVHETVTNMLCNNVEGVCSRHGFVKPDSVDVKAISSGVMSSERGGRTTFEVAFDAEVCNPVIGSTVLCRIEAVNNFAAFASNVSTMRVIEVIVPPEPKAFRHKFPWTTLKAGSQVLLRLMGKRFHLGQKTIVCAGQIVSEVQQPFDGETEAATETAIEEHIITEQPSMTRRSWQTAEHLEALARDEGEVHMDPSEADDQDVTVDAVDAMTDEAPNDEDINESMAGDSVVEVDADLHEDEDDLDDVTDVVDGE